MNKFNSLSRDMFQICDLELGEAVGLREVEYLSEKAAYVQASDRGHFP